MTIAGPAIRSPGDKFGASKSGTFAALAVEIGVRRLRRCAAGVRQLAALAATCVGDAADDFDARGDDLQRPARVDVAVALAMRGGERGGEIVVGRPGDRQTSCRRPGSAGRASASR